MDIDASLPCEEMMVGGEEGCEVIRRGRNHGGVWAPALGLVLHVLLLPGIASMHVGDARPGALGPWLRNRHATALRLRGGNYLDDVEPLEHGLDARDIQALHYDIEKDAAAGPMPLDFSRRMGNLSVFDEEGALDEQGATDGFPFDWTRFKPDARFHLGFRAPLKLQLNHSMYAEFDKHELVVVKLSDGSRRFAQADFLKSERHGHFT